MDHLVAPKQACQDVKAPFLGEWYDDAGFWEFPKRKGWDIQALVNAEDAFDRMKYVDRNTVQQTIDYLKELRARIPDSQDDEVKSAVDAGISFFETHMAERRSIGSHLGGANPSVFEIIQSMVELKYLQLVDTTSMTEQELEEAKQRDYEHALQTFQSFRSDITLREMMRDLLDKHKILKDSGQFAEAHHFWYTNSTTLLYWATFVPEEAGSLTDEVLEKGLNHLPAFLRTHKHLWPLSMADCETNTTTNAYAFIQSWLFFGLLKETFRVVGVEIEQSDYVDGDQFYITTEKLHSHVQKWEQLSKQRTYAERMREYRAIDHLTTQANFVIEAYEDPDHKLKLSASEITFSIQMLIYYLKTTASDIYGLPMEFAVRKFHSFQRYLFQKDGWCPNQVAYMQGLFQPWFQYYASLLGPTAKFKDHSKCTESLCDANQIDEACYETMHVKVGDDGDGCKLCEILGQAAPTFAADPSQLPENGSWGPEKQKLLDIVDRGGIPLISFANHYLEQFSLEPEIVEWQPGMEYVAISHVWADGRGNPVENTLPLCQLHSLRWWVGRMPQQFWKERHYIWIDTLCVPLTPVKSRKSAIANMRAAFTEAAAVVVLDGELLHAPPDTAGLEAMVRIVLSGWSRRLWTYQEAVMAKELFFVFGKPFSSAPTSFLDLLLAWDQGRRSAQRILEQQPQEEAAPEPENTPRFETEQRIWLDVFNRSPWFLLSRDTRHAIKDPFARVCAGLQWRNTSKPTDEPICLATLLELDVRQILDIETTPENQHSLQLKKILELQNNFRADMIFWRCARMPDYGYGWAPQTFMQSGKYLMSLRGDEEFPHTAPIPRGLPVKFPGLSFTADSEKVTLEENKRIFLGLTNFNRDDCRPWQRNWLYIVYLHIVDPNLKQRWIKPEATKLAIILGPGTGTVHTNPEGEEDQAGGFRFGALVEINERTDGVVYTQFLTVCSVTAARMMKEETEPQHFNQGVAREINDDMAIKIDDWFEDEQEWVVG